MPQRWFRAHQVNTYSWLKKHGGVLVIEGQSCHHRPIQEAYDAVLGPGVLSVEDIVPVNQPERLNLLLYPSAEPSLSPDQTYERIIEESFKCIISEDLSDVIVNPPRIPKLSEKIFSENLGERLQNYIVRGWFTSKTIEEHHHTTFKVIDHEEYYPIFFKEIYHIAIRYVRRKSVIIGAIVGRGVVIATTMMISRLERPTVLEAILNLNQL